MFMCISICVCIYIHVCVCVCVCGHVDVFVCHALDACIRKEGVLGEGVRSERATHTRGGVGWGQVINKDLYIRAHTHTLTHTYTHTHTQHQQQDTKKGRGGEDSVHIQLRHKRTDILMGRRH